MSSARAVQTAKSVSDEPAVQLLGSGSTVDVPQEVVSPDTTPCSSSANSGSVNQTPRKLILKKRIKQLMSHRWKMNRKIRTLRGAFKPKLAESSRLQTISDIMTAAEPFLSPLQRSLFQAQLMNSQRRRKGMRWSKTDKLFCLQFYYKSPSAYKFVRKCLALPSVSTVRSFVRGAVGRIDPGFNNVLLTLVELRIKHLPERDRQCSLVFDEMSLKSQLAYDKNLDYIVGYTADGKLATHVLVFMIRGLSMKWKQAISFHFTHNTVASATLAEFIIRSIQRLHDIGLSVRCIVCDQAATNVCALKQLGFDQDHPQIHCHGVTHAVHVVFDVPHLLKNVRNNLQKYKIKVDESVASWKDVESVYNLDKLCQIRLAPRLTDRHLEPSSLSKMRVRVAAQTLSHSVAAAVSMRILTKQLPPSAHGTADFVENMDTLFDLLNSRQLVGDKPARCALTDKNDILNQLCVMKEWVSKWQFVGARSQNIVKSHWGLLVTISSVVALSRELLHEGFKFVFTSRLNQDCIENFFACIRSKHGWCENPTPVHFFTAFKNAVILSSLDSTSSGKNCIADDDFQLIEHVDMPSSVQHAEEYHSLVGSGSTQQAAGETDSVWDDISNEILNTDICYESGIIETFTETFTEAEESLLHYLSGWLARKSAICPGCQDVLSKAKEEHSYCCSLEGSFASKKQYSNTGSVGLIEPSTELYAAVRVMENLFRSQFDEIKGGSRVALSLSNAIQPQCDFTFLFVRHPQHALYLSEKLVRMFVIMRIFYSIKFSNREIAAGASSSKTSGQSARRSENQRKMQKILNI